MNQPIFHAPRRSLITGRSRRPWGSACGAFPTPPGPLVEGPDGDRLLVEGARRLRESSDRAIVALFGGNLLEWGQFLYRNDNFLALLAGEPDRAHDLLERLTELHLTGSRSISGWSDRTSTSSSSATISACRPARRSLPGCTASSSSPAMRGCGSAQRSCRRQGRCCTACGGIRLLLPDLIDAGLDAVNPVQISCKGMEPEGLKRDFGKDITFWGGGCDTQWMLSHGTPEADPEPRQAAGGGSAAGRRFCLPAGAQHPRRRPPAEHRGDVRRGPGLAEGGVNASRKWRA